MTDPFEKLAALIADGVAEPNVVGGRPMKEWANLRPSDEKRWLGFATESLEYVRTKR